MHSRIFQLSKEPIDLDEHITEADFYDHWFLGAIADYVYDRYEPEKEDDVAWLAGRTGMEVNTETRCIRVISKEDYFREKYNEMIAIATGLVSGITLENFSGKVSDHSRDLALKIYNLKSSYNNEYEFYVYDDGSLMTLDSFIRNADEDVDYYIGGIVGYHY